MDYWGLLSSHSPFLPMDVVYNRWNQKDNDGNVRHLDLLQVAHDEGHEDLDLSSGNSFLVIDGYL